MRRGSIHGGEESKKTEYLSKIHDVLGGTTALCFQHSWRTQEGDGEK